MHMHLRLPVVPFLMTGTALYKFFEQSQQNKITLRKSPDHLQTDEACKFKRHSMMRLLVNFKRPCPLLLKGQLIKLLLKQFEPPHDKTNKISKHPAKTQISLAICPV